MGNLKITLVRSTIEKKKDQKATVEALGLHKVGNSVIKEDNPAIRGMIKKIEHLVEVEEI